MRGIRFWWLSECDRIIFKNIPNKLGILFLKINHCCCSLLGWILPREFLFLFWLNEDVQQLYVQKKAFHHMTPYTKNQPITRDFADRRPHNFEAESLICISLHPIHVTFSKLSMQYSAVIGCRTVFKRFDWVHKYSTYCCSSHVVLPR